MGLPPSDSTPPVSAVAHATPVAQHTQPEDRIQSLDVLRGVALLGILLMNIVGMGMLSTAYFNPLGGVAGAATSVVDRATWLATELLFEGSMRALFSMLFGAGVILFTTNKSGRLHYRRTFFLLLFGLFDGYLLLWEGDILVVYAVAGAILYWVRNASATRLVIVACALLVTLALIRGLAVFGLEEFRRTYETVAVMEMAGEEISAEQAIQVETWEEFLADGVLTEREQAEELSARRGSYVSAFRWNAENFTKIVAYALPAFLLWDALLMMLIGMAAFRVGILQGERSRAFYGQLAVGGIVFGVLVNSWELNRVIASDYDLLVAYSFLQPFYDLGRLGLSLGYMGLVLWWCKSEAFAGLRFRLAAVGRMALTNYLLHSLIALIVFTGAGFGLVSVLDRWQLYPVVLAIWLFQLWFSPWWLARHTQGPLEMLWRRLTYGV